MRHPHAAQFLQICQLQRPEEICLWEDVSSFFQFSDDIRQIMYTTNIIEGLNRQYRKVTKTKSVFPSDTSLEKMLYLVSQNVTKKCTQRYQNWDQILNQLIILYGNSSRNICKEDWAGRNQKSLPSQPYSISIYIISRKF